MASGISRETVSYECFRDSNGRSTTKASGITTSAADTDEPGEHSPLLSISSQEDPIIDLPARPRQWLSRRCLTQVLILVVILASAGDQLQESPQTRIFESIICYRYYEVADPGKLLLDRGSVGPGAIGGVAEIHCKVNAVQEQLAMLRGYQQLLDGIPALMLALPFGWAADRFGRKPLLSMGLLSAVFRFAWIQLVTWFWQIFDVRMTWLSTLHACFGGGSAVTTGVFFVILSDITPEAERASVFLQAGASSLLANLVMSPLSAWWMQTDPWIPNLIGILICVSTLLALPFIPETLGARPDSSLTSSRPSTPSGESVARPQDIAGASELVSTDLLARWSARFRDAISFLTQDWRILALCLFFFGHTLIASSSRLLLQYMSKRYNIIFADATMLLTVYNGVKVLLLFVLLPYLSTLSMRTFRLSGQTKDLYLARASQICVLIGFTLIGFSPNVPTVVVSMSVASLGTGTYLLIRSFITSLVPGHHIARVYSIMTLVDTIGAMLGGPILAGLFKSGLALGDSWIGLPFYFLGLMNAAFAVLIFAVRLRPDEARIKLPGEEADSR
ncbi:hypothetical protein LTR91_001493 [Friedmanniomyces endolithicus]|uniref:Major facilitator superfamily (MFS) profile domain-containing protein n=1 Tax=Friedmanniomyces endolithicus TaxID=329885 RepID=A0AAN6JF46_9PEZI|nr:hypothetical protein LTR82_001404 [Friedmanniomyces endolithicus]KAK0923647.1 hypothetical protein LTR57_006580 [Friedmanniomyces endolithicus]KAK0977984.1 hypothetical protein LTS01_012952 [Friedmanniomyces endolithicus]KAK0991145.1 hypothetical protein LTR54_011934 [Friedmanniomyces endolithicus]KAK1013182.1 hypothetical protein LTR91_001493 [Friedmanniomyces endolithicus]